jgi:uncharacterized protein YjcR
MSDLTSFRAIIELWGPKDAPGARIALAAEMSGVSPTQVSKWWQRDNIPAEYWSSLLSTDKAREAGVSSDLLTELAARECEARAC